MSVALVPFAPVGTADTLTIRTHYTAPETGTINLGYTGIRSARFVVDGELVLENILDTAGMTLGAALISPPSTSAPLHVTAGQVLDIVITVMLAGADGTRTNAMFFNVGTQADDSDPEGLIADAVTVARESEVAVVVVGTNSRVESEGFDRTSLALPGHQDALVHAVAAVNPNTIVIVNAGSPVLMPWRDEVAAVLLPYFPGQEFGNAVADIIFGDAEPGGRLPTTWPIDEASLPVGQVELVDGKVAYSEGIHIGYRAWLRSGAAWAYPFGHGLGYTTWSIDGASGPASVAAGDDLTVVVGVTNTGSRRGKQVVQVYAERPDSAIDRPVRWLVGFDSVELDPGASADVAVRVRGREFAHWADGAWQWEPGTFTLYAGTNVADTPIQLEVTVTT